jgi:electron transport complex protein RnfC
MNELEQSDFEQIIQQVNSDQLWDFPGGIFPPQHKGLSNGSAIKQLPLPERLFVTVKQHIGVEGHLIVEPGDHVLKGQPLTKSMNPFAVPVHAPTSGNVVKIAPHVSAHPSGLPELSVEIEPDGQDKWIALKPLQNYLSLPKASVLGAICDAGISGMGGAGFPTHIKAAPKKNVQFLLINGIECEPYITSDDRLMREHAWQIRQGIDVLFHLLCPKQVYIAIEDNKPEAIEAMQVACQENEAYKVCVVPTKYPAGGEKQLIQVLTGREVPQQGLPVDVGVIMDNVGTCFAIADAIFTGKPLIQRVVTLTGDAVSKPGNVWALIGTPISHLMTQSEYQADTNNQKVIMGGPMMGFTIASPDVPVVKITNCILMPTTQEMPPAAPEQPCIRCSACADVCPASLLPQQLFWHSKAKELDKAQDYNLFDCIECGACAYVCPSEIPLVHYYRVAKAEIRHEQQEKQKSDKARERFESRAARLLREQQARDEKHRKAAQARKEAMEASGNNAQDKIAAALARAKAKKAPLDSQTPAEEVEPEQVNSAPENKGNDRVAAAIARAKAKKAQHQVEDAPVAEPGTNAGQQHIEQTPPAVSKDERVAAAIARAKAKKAQHQVEDAPVAEPGTNAGQQHIEQTPPAVSKDERVAAAIARAKAKKAQHQVEDASVAEPGTNAGQQHIEQTPPAVSKDERVAAAIARAKAKKAQHQLENAPVTEPGGNADQQHIEQTTPATSTDETVTTSQANDSQTVPSVSSTASPSSALEADNTIDRPPAADVSVTTDSEIENIPETSDNEQASLAHQADSEHLRKQRIAQAVAKVKAKKRPPPKTPAKPLPTVVPPVDDNTSAVNNSAADNPLQSAEQALEQKKKRIAIAVAKAKAKKAAQSNQTPEG